MNKNNGKYYNQNNISKQLKIHKSTKNKLDGVVCSPNEIKYIRKEVGKIL